jgi:hypothetical protein
LIIEVLGRVNGISVRNGMVILDSGIVNSGYNNISIIADPSGTGDIKREVGAA